MPVRALVTEGTTADCTQAIALIDGFDAGYLLADRGYDTNSILEHVERQGISAVIPSKRNRKVQRAYDNLQSASPGGECFSPFEEMARDCHQIREKRGLIPCRHPYQARFPMASIS
jgi:transposase